MADTILYMLSPEGYFKNIVAIIKKEKNKSIVYVTTNKPYEHLADQLKKEKIDTDKIFFIDCISETVGADKVNVKNCLFLESPQQVTALSIAISQAIKLLPKDKVLLIDSLSALLVYNGEDLIGKFTNFLINKMRMLKNVSTIIVCLKSDADRKVIKTIESFVDEVKG